MCSNVALKRSPGGLWIHLVARILFLLSVCHIGNQCYAMCGIDYLLCTMHNLNFFLAMLIFSQHSITSIHNKNLFTRTPRQCI